METIKTIFEVLLVVLASIATILGLIKASNSNTEDRNKRYLLACAILICIISVAQLFVSKSIDATKEDKERAVYVNDSISRVIFQKDVTIRLKSDNEARFKQSIDQLSAIRKTDSNVIQNRLDGLDHHLKEMKINNKTNNDLLAFRIIAP